MVAPETSEQRVYMLKKLRDTIQVTHTHTIVCGDVVDFPLRTVVVDLMFAAVLDRKTGVS